MTPPNHSTRIEWSGRLAQALVQGGYETEASLDPLLAKADDAGQPLATLLISTGRVHPGVVVGALAHLSGLPAVDLAAITPDDDALACLPRSAADEHAALALRHEGDVLVVAFSEPPTSSDLDALAELVGRRVEPVLADPVLIKEHLAVRRDGQGEASGSVDSEELLHQGIPTQADSTVPLHVDDLLRYAVAVGASDIHLVAGHPASMRLHGALRPIEGCPVLVNEVIREMIFGILPASQRERFEDEKELDTSHSIAGVGRFRLNVSLQRATVAAALRPIPHVIPDFDTLGIPDTVKAFTELKRGLVLVTGPTGSGKSTTLASIVDIINRTKPLHIVTVEDPIEFLHESQRSVITEREVGEDTDSFAEALRRVLRQDPDVILVGELRDLETISMALTAAETGHLVFGTLHTQDAPQTVDRVIDVFPTSQQEQIRVMLASTLEGIVTQQLVVNADGTGRVVCAEVLVCTSAARNLIRQSKTHQIYSLMQVGGSFGMQTMDQGLARLVKEGKITESMAYDRSSNEEDLRNHLAGETRPPHPARRRLPVALTFDYKVRDRAGGLVEGQLEGDSMTLVVRRLREMGYIPISVTPRSNVNLNTEIKIPGLSDRVKLREVAVMTRQLSTMVDSGLSVVRSLGILSTQAENPTLSRILSEVRLDLEHGSSLSAACAKHPKVFSHLFCTLVQAGEAGGNLDEVLSTLAETMEKQAQLNRTIRSAMTYPAVVLSVMIVIFTAMIVFIVPIFQKLFSSLGGKLPLPTRLLIKVSQIISSVWVLLLIAVVIGGIVALRKWISTEEGRRRWDRLKLKPPIFGALFHKVALARMTSTLSSLIGSGVPILEALDISADTAGNRTVGDVLVEAKNGVREGRSLADPLRAHEKVIPPLTVQMIEVGEQTGALDGMLRKVSQFYDQEVEATVNNLTSLLEPLLTVIMGIGVGLMVISLYLPMFDYIKLIPTN